MSITIENKDSYNVIKIHKEKLDSTLSPDLKAEFVVLNKAGTKNIVVDLDEVQYCDSSGLSALLIGNRLCNELKGKFVINSLQPMVKKMIQISQLDKILLISDSLEKADEMMARAHARRRSRPPTRQPKAGSKRHHLK